MRRKKSVFLVLILFSFIMIANLPSACSEGTIEKLSSGASSNLYGLDWKPNGNYALIVGGEGTVLKYNGENFEDLTSSSGTTKTLKCVSWKPDGSYALIGGGDGFLEGTLLRYDGSTFTDLTDAINTSGELVDIAWSPLGNYALIIARGFLYSGMVVMYDGANFEKLHVHNRSLSGIGWNHNSNYALIVGNSGTVIKYDGSVFTNLSTGVKYDLIDVHWSPDYSSALIFGQDILTGKIIRYDGSTFADVSELTEDLFYGFEWHPDGEHALAVGPFIDVSIYNQTGFTDVVITVFASYEDVSWNYSGDYALIVGGTGTVLKYTEPVSNGNNGPPIIPSDGGFELDFMMLLIIIGIAAAVIVVVLAVVLTKKKKKPAKPAMAGQADTQPQAFAPGQAPLQDPFVAPVEMPSGEPFLCPDCGNVFILPSNKRPLDIECPYCGIEGTVE